MLDESSRSHASEEWRAIPGFEGLYEVSDLGRVRSLRLRGNATFGSWDRLRPEPRVLQLPVLGTGYAMVSLGRAHRRSVHRLVLEAFVGPCPPGMQAAHLNGQRADNRLANLTWKTVPDNIHDKWRHGTMVAGDQHYARRRPEKLARGDRNGSRLHPELLQRGERHHSAKLTESDVREIRRRADEGTTALGRAFGVTPSAVEAVVHRQTWSHVPDEVLS